MSLNSVVELLNLRTLPHPCSPIHPTHSTPVADPNDPKSLDINGVKAILNLPRDGSSRVGVRGGEGEVVGV
jgi:hypothetical protein